jgi:hypothetical protein
LSSQINVVIPLVDRNNGVYPQYADLSFNVDISTISGIDHFRLRIPNPQIWGINKTIRLTRFKVLFIQLDSDMNELSRSEYNVTDTTDTLITAETGVTYLTIAIEEWEYTVSGSTGLYYYNQRNSCGLTILQIKVENSDNDELYRVDIVGSDIVWSYHAPTTYNVKPPENNVVFTPNISNITNYLQAWYVLFKSCTGNPEPTDSIGIHLLDASDTVLSEMSGGISGEGNISTSHDPETAKVKIDFNVTSKIIFNGDIAIEGNASIVSGGSVGGFDFDAGSMSIEPDYSVMSGSDFFRIIR